MSEQPPVQPPNQPPNQPSNQPPNRPTQGVPPTMPMPAAPEAPPVGATAGPASPYPPKTTVWHQATSTSGRRWALALTSGALALLLILGVAFAGFMVLRNHDRVGLFGNRDDRQLQRQDRLDNGRGNGNGNNDERRSGRGPGANDRNLRGTPGIPGGGAQGLGGLGNLVGGGALHGEVTATVNGSVQALVFQRGEVTAVSDTSITLKSSDGFTGTYGRTAATSSRGAALVKGGQALVLARASDKVAITTLRLAAAAGVGPSS